MARTKYKFPNIFVACPYDEKKFKYSQFKEKLSSLPFVLEFADTNLETKHLLERLKRIIKANDFSFFDLSLWNPNVSLELGLAEGLKAEYYILVNSKLDTDVPADIQGIQRIQYPQLDKGEKNLINQLINFFFKKKYPLTKKLWQSVSRHHNSQKIYTLSLRILAFLRDHNAISETDIKDLSKGLRIFKKDQKYTIDTLLKLNIIYKGRRRKRTETEFLLKKNIFKK